MSYSREEKSLSDAQARLVVYGCGDETSVSAQVGTRCVELGTPVVPASGATTALPSLHCGADQMGQAQRLGDVTLIGQAL